MDLFFFALGFVSCGILLVAIRHIFFPVKAKHDIERVRNAMPFRRKMSSLICDDDREFRREQGNENKTL